MSLLDQIKSGFALGVPASRDVLERIRAGVLVHRTRARFLPVLVTGLYRTSPDGFSNARVRMTGDFGLSPLDLFKATVRDHRVVDFQVFQGSGGRAFHDFVYFFLGEPEDWQIGAQNFGGSGDAAMIRVRGADLLADPGRRIFYRRGLFWEADRAVIVKGGYEGPAKVELPQGFTAPLI
ncbi:hypothetical protein JMJ55_26045 [Belnapia sp. T6]|uniref:Uncharacterized protein n=1 Tax=Belnapia mucosa TaxID=2804532 RepID=A0ABS1VBU9_9PROT|nr:hypothetical protein [Belnapia mucosa]MBL6458797.1 hypothetical protein [Belnapia mucosa]